MSIQKMSLHIINIMRKYKIRSRMLILLIAFTILPTQIILLIAKNNITTSFTSLNTSYWETSQSTIENNLANMLNQIDFCAYQVLNDGMVFSSLNSKSMQYQNREKYLAYKLGAIASNSSQVEKISIISKEDEQFSSDNTSNPYLNCSMLSFVNTLPVIIQIPTKSLVSGNNIQIRTLIDFSSGIVYGYLCIYIADSAIYNCYKNVISNNDKCMIINRTGQVVFNDKKAGTDDSIPIVLLNQTMGNAQTYYQKKL